MSRCINIRDIERHTGLLDLHSVSLMPEHLLGAMHTTDENADELVNPNCQHFYFNILLISFQKSLTHPFDFL